MTNKKILFFTDNPEHESEVPAFADEGFSVVFAESDTICADFTPIIIDMSGFDETLALIRQNRARDALAPIIVLSSRADELSTVLCLEVGADDFLVTPRGVREIAARVRAIVRRGEAAQEFSPIIAVRELTLNEHAHTIFKNGKPLTLTSKEYEFLRFLMKNPGTVFGREELMTNVWGYGYAGETRTVDVHVRQLRKKIEKDGNAPEYIKTVRGAGYMLAAEKEEQ
ncbi:hypothetical protein FACS189490_06810 [Clostridia bacterium]|nr:hypothetical protein FACS189490_06810 [Clostridia bacterium]